MSSGIAWAESTEVGNFTLCLRSVLQPGEHLNETGLQEMTWEKSTVFKLWTALNVGTMAIGSQRMNGSSQGGCSKSWREACDEAWFGTRPQTQRAGNRRASLWMWLKWSEGWWQGEILIKTAPKLQGWEGVSHREGGRENIPSKGNSMYKSPGAEWVWLRGEVKMGWDTDHEGPCRPQGEVSILLWVQWR